MTTRRKLRANQYGNLLRENEFAPANVDAQFMLMLVSVILFCMTRSLNELFIIIMSGLADSD